MFDGEKSHAHATVRRLDRAVTDDSWIENFLAKAPYGVLALFGEEFPHQNINLFVFDPRERSLFFHTANQSSVRRAVERNPSATFSSSHMGRLLPAKTATQLSVEYESVIAYGRIQIIADHQVAAEKMQILIDKYFPHLRRGEDYAEIGMHEIERITAYEFKIATWTAKRKQERPDFPGAFRFGHQS